MEAVILLENSGFFVDAVTTDGASWNRKMWSEFEISDYNVSCIHPSDPERRLWFLSDFPHLIKNLRNFITDKKFVLVSIICTRILVQKYIYSFDFVCIQL